MKVNVSVLIGCVLCVVMIAGIRVLRSVDEHHDMWRPNDIYTQVGGSSYSSVSYAPALSVSSGVPVSMSKPVFSRRTPIFSARVNNPSPMTYGQSPISVGGSSVGAIHTTSSAQYRSFGSGTGAGVSMSGGSVRANASQPSAAMTSVSMPSMPTASPLLLTSSSSQSAPAEAILANNSAYQGIGNTTASGPLGIRGQQRAPGTLGGEDGNYINWLESKWDENYNLTEQQIRDLYVALTGDTSFQNVDQWNAFWEWFMGNQSDPNFKWKLPISDAVPFVLLLCVAYALYIFITRKQIQKQ